MFAVLPGLWRLCSRKRTAVSSWCNQTSVDKFTDNTTPFLHCSRCFPSSLVKVYRQVYVWYIQNQRCDKSEGTYDNSTDEDDDDDDDDDEEEEEKDDPEDDESEAGRIKSGNKRTSLTT